MFEPLQRVATSLFIVKVAIPSLGKRLQRLSGASNDWRRTGRGVQPHSCVMTYVTVRLGAARVGVLQSQSGRPGLTLAGQPRSLRGIGAMAAGSS